MRGRQRHSRLLGQSCARARLRFFSVAHFGSQGYAGPLCEDLLFPACRMTLGPHENGALPPRRGPICPGSQQHRNLVAPLSVSSRLTQRKIDTSVIAGRHSPPLVPQASRMRCAAPPGSSPRPAPATASATSTESSQCGALRPAFAPSLRPRTLTRSRPGLPHASPPSDTSSPPSLPPPPAPRRSSGTSASPCRALSAGGSRTRGRRAASPMSGRRTSSTGARSAAPRPHHAPRSPAPSPPYAHARRSRRPPPFPPSLSQEALRAPSGPARRDRPPAEPLRALRAETAEGAPRSAPLRPAPRRCGPAGTLSFIPILAGPPLTTPCARRRG